MPLTRLMESFKSYTASKRNDCWVSSLVTCTDLLSSVTKSSLLVSDAGRLADNVQATRR